MTNIDGLENLEKALEIMNGTCDAMSNTLMKSISYKESYNKDGISFDINGQGFVRNLKFANGTPPSMIENAINSTIEKVKLHFEEIYFNSLPLEIRQAALDKSQKMEAMLDMLAKEEERLRREEEERLRKEEEERLRREEEERLRREEEERLRKEEEERLRREEEERLRRKRRRDSVAKCLIH